MTNLTIFGAGTLLHRTDTYYPWEVGVKDISAILEYGVGAFTEDEWFKITPSDTELEITEQTYISVPTNSTIALRLEKNNNVLKDLSYYNIDITSCKGQVDPNNPRNYIETTTPTDYGVQISREQWFTKAGEDNILGPVTVYFKYMRMQQILGWVKVIETPISYVDISQYGITLIPDNSTPSEGDIIKVVVSEDDWKLKIDSDGVKRGKVQQIPLDPITVSLTNPSVEELASVEYGGHSYYSAGDTFEVPTGDTVMFYAQGVQGANIYLNNIVVATTGTGSGTMYAYTASGKNITVAFDGDEIVPEIYIEEIDNEDTEIIWEPTTLEGFNIGYKGPSDSSFTTLDSLNLKLDNFNWSARTLLSLNITNKKEQVLLDRQSLTAYLNIWYYGGEAISPENNAVYFVIDDAYFEITTSIPVTSLLYDLRTEELYINGELSNYNITTQSSGANIPVVNEVVINGKAIEQLDNNNQLSCYPTTLMSNFDLYLDGSQKLYTYNINDDGDFEFLDLYKYKKVVSFNPQIHISSDGEIDLLFKQPNELTITLPFHLPNGEYILPIELGSEELDRSENTLTVTLNSEQLHSIYSDEETNFNKKQRYFVYMNLQNDGISNLTFTIGSNITKDVPLVLRNLYKYNYQEGLSEFQCSKYVKLLHEWDVDNLYNYTYKVNEDEEISNPLEGKSFFLNNHIFNKFTIPQISSMDINILGKK